MRICVLVLLSLMSFGELALSEAVSDTASAGGYINNSDAVYLTNRNDTSGWGAFDLHTDIIIGQRLTSYTIWRSFIGIPIGDLSSATVSACTLYVSGDYDNSSADFNVNVYGANEARSSIDSGDYDSFDGWVSSGTYSGTSLNETWNTSSYSAAWNALVFNTAGVDSVIAASNDTLWVALISAEDATASAPVGDEYIVFDGAGATGSDYKPYLSIEYTTGWTGTVMGVENPDVIFGLPKADVASVMGVE